MTTTKMTPVQVMEDAVKEHCCYADHHDYGDQQNRALYAAIPRLMRALLTQDKAELDAIANQLDGWCWHVPHCEKGERCDNAEPNLEQRILAGVEERPAEEAD